MTAPTFHDCEVGRCVGPQANVWVRVVVDDIGVATWYGSPSLLYDSVVAP